MKVVLGFVGLMGLVSCSGKGDDTSTPVSHGKASLTIVSPAEGDTYLMGDEISFEVTASYEDGTEAELSDAVWSSGDWGRTGTPVTDTALPAGDLAISVTASVDGHELTSSVNITVSEPVDTSDSGETGDTSDTSDTSDGSKTYGGRFNANLTYDVYTVACPGVIHLTIDADDAITGSGECYVTELDTDVTFDVDGTLSGSALSGNLIMTGTDGTEYLTPYTGTLASDHIDGVFDQTFTSSDGSLTIDGTFSADRS